MNRKFWFPARCSMFDTEPVTRLSMPTTRWPFDNSRSLRCEPRKPAAPVMTDVGGEFAERFDFGFVAMIRVWAVSPDGRADPSA